MRIFLAVEGTWGDVGPMLSLGQGLQTRGHTVVVCAPPDFGAAAVGAGLGFRPVGEAARPVLTALSAAVVAGGGRFLRTAHRYGIHILEAQFLALTELTQGADAIVATGIQFAAATAAELHGIPYRYLAYCPAMIPSQENAPFLFSRQGMSQRGNRWAWRATSLFANQTAGRRVSRHRKKLGLAPVRSLLAHVLGKQPLLAADPDLAPVSPDTSVRIQRVGRLHGPNGSGLPPKVAAFLEQGPPPVYFGFGSMTTPEPHETTRLLLGAINGVGCRALISQGWAALGRDALSSGVLTIGDVCHADLFPHVAAVVHHGGAGTTHATAYAGVPQLVVPHVFDQYYWARRVTELGLGPPPVRRSALTRDRLVAALGELIDNEVIQDRAREFGHRVRSNAIEAVPAGTLF